MLIPPGEFLMGSPDNQKAPQHRVKISQPYYLGKHEVTQAQWEAEQDWLGRQQLGIVRP